MKYYLHLLQRFYVVAVYEDIFDLIVFCLFAIAVVAAVVDDNMICFFCIPFQAEVSFLAVKILQPGSRC